MWSGQRSQRWAEIKSWIECFMVWVFCRSQALSWSLIDIPARKSEQLREDLRRGKVTAGLAATSRQPGEQINKDVCQLPNDDCFPCTWQISHWHLCWGHSNQKHTRKGILGYRATTETIQTTVTRRHCHHWHFNEDRNRGSVLRNQCSGSTDLDQLAAKAWALSHRTQYSWLLFQESSQQGRQ